MSAIYWEHHYVFCISYYLHAVGHFLLYHQWDGWHPCPPNANDIQATNQLVLNSGRQGCLPSQYDQTQAIIHGVIRGNSCSRTWCGVPTALCFLNTNYFTNNGLCLVVLGGQASLPATFDNKLVGSMCDVCVRRAGMPALPVVIK